METRGYEGFENLIEEGEMKIIGDPDNDLFIDENKSLAKSNLLLSRLGLYSLYCIIYKLNEYDSYSYYMSHFKSL